MQGLEDAGDMGLPMTGTPTERPTPQQMADWLIALAEELAPSQPDQRVEGTIAQVAAYLRRQPTEAQKIEALRSSGDATFEGLLCDSLRRKRTRLEREEGARAARRAAHHARHALRLLGIDPEAPV